MPWVHGKRIADILQLDVSGELGADDGLLDAVHEHLEQGQRRFVVSLMGVETMSDTGISQIVEARSLVQDAGGCFALALPNRLLPRNSGWRNARFRFETAQEAVESLLRE